jgi:hypothetical protein
MPGISLKDIQDGNEGIIGANNPNILPIIFTKI